MPIAGAWPHAVLMDDIVLFWGGDAVAWDIERRGWTPVPSAPIGPDERGDGVWTGQEALFWGPLDTRRAFSLDAGWRELPLDSSADSVVDFHAVWTGTEMLVWGGQSEAGCMAERPAAYDPSTDTWRPISTAGAPSPRLGHAVVWTGAEMVIFGGVTAPFADECQQVWTYESEGGSFYGVLTGTAHAYDPVADTWREVSSARAPAPQWFGDTLLGEGLDPPAFWTGTHALFGGGVDLDGNVQSGGLYDPATDTWTAVPPMTSWGAGWWADGRIHSWSGFELVRFDPTTGEETVERAPDWHGESTVWTGAELVAWGGRERLRSGGLRQTAGWLYEPPP